MAAFRELELLVARIQQQLAPRARIEHNVKMPGRNSKTLRQIDVLVTDTIGQYSINIVIECKDTTRPADVPVVDGFASVLDDVGAQRGVLVCPAGFTQAAKHAAQFRQIDLYSPIDTDLHKWTAQITMPAIVDFRSPAISFGLQFSFGGPMRLPHNFQDESIFYDENGSELGTIAQAGLAKWERGEFPTEPGFHQKLPVFESEQALTDNGFGDRVPFKVTADVIIHQEIYFGQYPINKISGFHDRIQDKVITNAFEIGLIDPYEVRSSWMKIDSVANAPIPPVFSLTGIVGFDWN